MALKEALTEQIAALAAGGVTDFLSGMAQGTDLWCSQIVLALRKKAPELGLHCVLPCADQEKEWSISAQEQYHDILRQADEVIYINHAYHEGCMLERNHFLVDHSEILLAVWNGRRRSGTGATVGYARKCGREIILVHPLTRRISCEPSLDQAGGGGVFFEL